MIKIKNIYKVFAALFILLLVIQGISSVKAETNFEISEYYVNLIVLENKSVEVEEIICINFLAPSHGIYREIPISENEAIFDIEVEGHNFETYDEDGYKIIKIGSADEIVDGEQEYRIYYTFQLNDDAFEDYDEFYYNLVGAGWSSYINDVYITVEMPKEFNENKVGVSCGLVGTMGCSKVDYFINNNIITITTNEKLNPYEGITVRMELDDGYFAETNKEGLPINNFIWLIPIIVYLIG